MHTSMQMMQLMMLLLAAADDDEQFAACNTFAHRHFALFCLMLLLLLPRHADVIESASTRDRNMCARIYMRLCLVYVLRLVMFACMFHASKTGAGPGDIYTQQCIIIITIMCVLCAGSFVISRTYTRVGASGVLWRAMHADYSRWASRAYVTCLCLSVCVCLCRVR